MTWGKAAPVLVVSAVFDVLRLMFVMFIFFGPALAGLYCAYEVSGWIGTAFGLTAAACAAGAIAAGFFGAPAFIAFGVVMAMAVGLAGWLTVGLILIIFNGRIFKENALWFVGSLLFSEVPIIGAIPVITVSVWKMHSNQIRIEKAVYKKWQKENAARQLQERQRQQNAQLMRYQAGQIAVAQQQASNDAVYTEAANDEKYGDEEIPEEVREAA